MLISEQASAGGGFGLHEWQAIRFLLRHESTCVLRTSTLKNTGSDLRTLCGLTHVGSSASGPSGTRPPPPPSKLSVEVPAASGCVRNPSVVRPAALPLGGWAPTEKSEQISWECECDF